MTSQTKSDDIIVRARKDFERCQDAWRDNQARAKEDLRFARLGEQWPEVLRRQRELELRPCLTFNKLPAFIRQVVNEARQNKPAIKVHPMENGDKAVAEIINGLIRNLEAASDADVAYDTAIEQAVGQGFGFWRINTRYTSDDAFDQDIVIERIANPLTVLGDPRSTAADSSDWNICFVVTTMTRDEFEREYPDAKKIDWDHDFIDCPGWLCGEDVTVAEYWTREKVTRRIVQMSDGSVMDLDQAMSMAGELVVQGIVPVGQARNVIGWKVLQHIISGAEVLRTVEWVGKHIPIVPVYGDEVIDDSGKRHFRSLIRDARSAQEMFNYWRTMTTELVSLAPKAPWIGEERSFLADPNWDTANTVSHSKLVVPDGAPLPQRQPFSGVPAGALQEALNASDDMKSIIGMYDASLGARSNEVSGRAILARQREGDVSTFHFIDNLSRSIRHSGRIILDLISKVYTTERTIRVLGEDLSANEVQIGPTGQPIKNVQSPSGVHRIYDLAVGKYDLSVSTGPAFTTRREEARLMMTEAAQAGGESVAAVLLPRIVKMMDIPDSDDIAAELQLLNPAKQQRLIPLEVEEQLRAGMERIQQVERENHALKTDAAGKAEERALKQQELRIKAAELEVKRVEAEAKLIAAQHPTFVRAPTQQSM